MSGEKPENEHSQAIQVKPASLDDIPELVPVMKRAFDDDTQKHLGKPRGGPEGYDDGDSIRWNKLPRLTDMSIKGIKRGT